MFLPRTEKSFCNAFDPGVVIFFKSARHAPTDLAAI